MRRWIKQVKVDRPPHETSESWNVLWRNGWKSYGFVEKQWKVHKLFNWLKSSVFFLLHPEDRFNPVTVTVLRGYRQSTSECFEINRWDSLLQILTPLFLCSDNSTVLERHHTGSFNMNDSIYLAHRLPSVQILFVDPGNVNTTSYVIDWVPHGLSAKRRFRILRLFRD